MTSTAIEDYDPMSLHFDVIFEAADAGRHPEDGEPLSAEAYYVRAEAPNGVRWYRYVGMSGWKTDDGDDEWGPRCYPQEYDKDGNEVTGKIVDVATWLAMRLEASPTRRLNPVVWAYAGACYGSNAYQALNIEEETAALEREAERWG